MIAAMLAGKATARAFLKGAPVGSGIVLETTGTTPEEAMARLIEALKDRDRAARQARRVTDGKAPEIPTETEFLEALIVLQPSPAEWAMLNAHAKAGQAGLTAGDLALAAGWSDYSAANLHYGLLARKVADVLSVKAVTSDRDEAPAATYLLASGDWVGPDGTFLWWMHPELIAAVAEFSQIR